MDEGGELGAEFEEEVAATDTFFEAGFGLCEALGHKEGVAFDGPEGVGGGGVFGEFAIHVLEGVGDGVEGDGLIDHESMEEELSVVGDAVGGLIEEGGGEVFFLFVFGEGDAGALKGFFCFT